MDVVLCTVRPLSGTLFCTHFDTCVDTCVVSVRFRRRLFLLCSSGPNADKIVPYFGNLFTDEPLPIDGYIDLDPKKPGTWVAPMVMVDCLCKEYVLKDYSFEK